MKKIVFYQERTFGDKFNVSFEFIKQNWKILLRYISYVILPLSFVGALTLNSFIQNVYDTTKLYDANAYVGIALPYVFTVIVFGLGAYWLAITVFSLMQVYNLRENGLDDVNFSELKGYFKRNAWRLFKSGVVVTLFILAVVIFSVALAAAIHWILAVFLFIALMALYVPMIMIFPTYIYEDISIWKAFGRGITLGWKTWGGIFALGLVLGLLANVVISVFSLPWEVCFVLKGIFLQGEISAEYTFTSSVWFTLITYVFSIVMLYVQFVTYSLFFVSTSYLYSHAAEQQDDMSVEEGVANFNELADNNQDIEKEDIWS